MRDQVELWPVRRRETRADAHVFSFVTDEIVAPSGEALKRSFLHHPGAVAIIALDDEDNVVVIDQYRHPVGLRMIEPPAGLLDHEGEDYLVAAQRELAEEALLRADDWRTLADVCGSPGSSQESARIFLARGLHEAPRPDGFVVEGEEAHMSVARVPLADLVDGILAGELQNLNLVVGILTLAAAKSRGSLDDLRPADAPWPARDAKRAQDHAAVDDADPEHGDD